MILYKKDTKGKIRSLDIEALNHIIFQISGILGGKLVEHRKIIKGKNIGKSNETSAIEQAMKEVDALIKKKLREGYFKTIEEAKEINVILPMLAKDYNKEKKKINWEGDVFVQPKLDGMRCLAFIKDGVVKLMSRKGVEITTMPHIVNSLSSIKGEIILDGELYCHGKSFQENMSLIKKWREGESEQIKYHIYDTIQNLPFGERLNIIPFDISYCEVVKTYPGEDENSLKKRHSLFLEEGYEGTIIRHGMDGYKIGGRSSNLLKYKDFIDETYKIIDVVPMEVRPEQGVVVCMTLEGREFKATPKMSFAEREHLLSYKEKIIGLTAEIRFFEYTDEGLPRFPIFVGVRLDK